jgi:hypothetical protein
MQQVKEEHNPKFLQMLLSFGVLPPPSSPCPLLAKDMLLFAALGCYFNSFLFFVMTTMTFFIFMQ